MIQTNDFIEIEYTGKTKDEGFVFDTTDEKIAKKEQIDEEHAQYGPVIICVGQGQVLSGLDKNLIGKEVGKEYSITLQPEEAFGKKSAKLVQMIPARKFIEQKIMPQPGLQVSIDGMNGIIKTASGGRILVDFNHPLSSKVVEYNLKVLRKVEDDKEKLSGYLKISLGLKDAKIDIADGKADVTLKVDIPKEISTELAEKIKAIIPTLKEINFKKEEVKKEAPKKEAAKESTPK